MSSERLRERPKIVLGDMTNKSQSIKERLASIKQGEPKAGDAPISEHRGDGREERAEREECRAARPTTLSHANGLAARLESLKHRKEPAGGHNHVHTGDDPHNSLSKAAQQLFGDAEFVAMCERGLNAQLTRTRDGATQETKMRELAEIVKMMRRSLKEMQHRTQAYVEQSVKYERSAKSAIENLKLSADSAATLASAELAKVRVEAATDIANQKAAVANWQSEMDLLQAELASMKRENERLAEGQVELQGAFDRMQTEKGGVESELLELKRMNANREKELQAGKNQATQTVYQVKEDFERQRSELQAALAEAEEKIRAAEEGRRDLMAQLKLSKEEEEKIGAQARKMSVEWEAATAELEAAKKSLEDVHSQHAKVTAELSTSEHDKAAQKKSLDEWQKRASSLLEELEKERSVTASLKQSLDKYANTAANKEESLKETQSKYEKTLAETVKMQELLENEAVQLKATVERVNREHEEAQDEIARLTGELEGMTVELTETKDALVALQTEAASALESIDKANKKATAAEDRLAQVEREAEDKASKLAQLEGELEALQECTYGMEGADQKELINRMVTKIASLEAACVAADTKRREAHNQLVELKGNIRVFCRVKPNPSSVAQISSDGSSIRVYQDSKPYEFNFDKVFTPDSTQSDIFAQVSDLVQSALDGYNVCLFSYGQTGAGKTHTMQGISAPGQEGIIPRSIAKILKTVETLKEQGWEYTLEASFVEVYNEQLRDLLVEGKGAGKITENNAIQHAPNGGHTIIQGAMRMTIASEQDADAIVARAAESRAVESTAMNSTSSRSHSIFMLYISGCHEATETSLKGSLNLVDLAGSERLARSQAEGQRAKEACSINKSLSSLGDVFAALSAKQAHIPYRNSKLTHLLQPCLGGSGKTLMFVNINPEPASAQESLCSLRFASKVNQCETGARGGAKRHTSMLERGRPSETGDGRKSSMMGKGQSMIPGAAGAKRKAGAAGMSAGSKLAKR